MNAQKALDKFLKETGWSQARLAAESGVDQSIISRMSNGADVRVSTLEKLWPFLYGDRRPQPEGEPLAEDRRSGADRRDGGTERGA